MKRIKNIVNYLKQQKLILTTAESCTAGSIIQTLAKYEGSGEFLDTGYIVYSINAKKRLLHVQQKTIDKYTLTSEAVVCEMVEGALKDSDANLAVGTTGIAGSEPMDNIPPGTICFGWAFKDKDRIATFSETRRFEGTRSQILKNAAQYALSQTPEIHKKLKKNITAQS